MRPSWQRGGTDSLKIQCNDDAQADNGTPATYYDNEASAAQDTDIQALRGGSNVNNGFVAALPAASSQQA